MTPDEIAYEVELAINSWSAKDREQIADFAGWCMDSAGHTQAECDQTHDAVLAQGRELAWYGPMWVDHDRELARPCQDEYCRSCWSQLGRQTSVRAYGVVNALLYCPNPNCLGENMPF